MKCDECDLVYVSERPTPPWIEMRRIEPYRSVPFPDVIINRANDLKDESNKVLKRMKQYQSSGRLLEVGCLTGHFLDLARKAGYDVTGLDPDATAAEYARQNFDLNIYEGTAEDLPFEDGMFDSAVMIGVLEHLTEPKQVIGEVRRVLSDSGTLMIEIPIIDTFLFRLLGKYHRHIIMDHILLFSQRSIHNFLAVCGFYPVHTELCGRQITLGRVAWNCRNYSDSAGSFLEGLLKRMGLYDFKMHVKLGDVLQIYCKKKMAVS
jgi:SAM-dependent methyltransferase